VRSEAIPLEMCPISNVKTRAVASVKTHPIDRLFRKGVQVTVSTDGRTVCENTITGEFEQLAKDWGWGLNEFFACQKNAAEAAFVSPDVRRELLARIEQPTASAHS
jgi:adenosine deaminase